MAKGWFLDLAGLSQDICQEYMAAHLEVPQSLDIGWCSFTSPVPMDPTGGLCLDMRGYFKFSFFLCVCVFLVCFLRAFVGPIQRRQGNLMECVFSFSFPPGFEST